MRLDDKSALVTGSTDGVGRVVATRLGEAGARVLVHGRDAERGAAVVADIQEVGGRAEFLGADFASLAEVRRFADAVRHRFGRLDILINNAGIGFGGGDHPGRELSADGYELRFAVNYLSGFLLTTLLFPLLVQSAPARIINVASAGQYPIDFDDVMLTVGYDGRRAYRQSKLAQIMATFDWARELREEGVTVNCLHPATFMNTTMVRQSGIEPWSTVDEGAEAILHLAASPAVQNVTGRYFDGMRESRADAQAYDEEARGRLHALSLELCGLRTGVGGAPPE